MSKSARASCLVNVHPMTVMSLLNQQGKTRKEIKDIMSQVSRYRTLLSDGKRYPYAIVDVTTI